MEQSIEIVKVILGDLKANRVHGQFTEEQFMKENHAIENLIKGYRDLQKEADKLISQNEWYKDYYDCESVPKSKIIKLKQNLEEEYISLEKNKTEQSIHVMLGLNSAIDKISKLMEGK